MPYTKEKQDEYNKEYYPKNKERIKANRRKYYRENVEKCVAAVRYKDLSDEAKKNKTDKQREDRKNFPEKHRARKMVGRAVKSGKLVRGLCEMCGHSTVEAHHDDYSKPLDVRWLCRYHHRVVEGRTI